MAKAKRGLTPKEFWLKAAQWGTYMRSGDPGACMYGFDERGAVQSEQHRQDCIDHIESDCRRAAKLNEDPEANNRELNALVAYLRTAPIDDGSLPPARMRANEFVPHKCLAMLDGLDDFTRGYLECAEFTDCTDDNPDLDGTDGFSPEFRAEAKRDCAHFQEANADDLARYYEVTGRPEDHAGHDFWLTRNGHGTGFWDRGNDPVLRKLSDAAHVYGSVDLYAGDDNLIYGA